ncbi:MAG: hypothetical protein R2706_05955 [Acidimicrobiales bacterium]
MQEVDGTHDLFGDGLLVCVPTPGHTPGHQSLRVLLRERTSRAHRRLHLLRVALRLSRARFGHDAAQQLASMKLLRSMSDDGCRLLFGHDRLQLAAIPEGGLV